MLEERLSRLPGPLRGTAEIVRSLAQEWKDDRVSGLAAGIAFYGILSLFPGLLTLATALGALEPLVGDDAAASAEENLVDYLTGTLALDPASPTTDAVQGLFDQPSAGVAVFAVAAALWAMSRGFAGLVQALDAVYDLVETRGWVRTRLTAIGLAAGTVVVSAVVLVMLVLGPLLGAGEELADDIGLGGLFVTFWDVFRAPVAFVLLTLWMAAIFHLAPNHHTPWRADLPGALATAGGVLALSLGFRLYLSVAGSGNAVYGVLGGAITLLLYLYFVGVLVLLGGELNAILWERGGHDKAQGRSRAARAGASPAQK